MLYNFDRTFLKQHGLSSFAGIDEAGRGPLAGPVCAAVVILDMDIEISGINDSKKLTAKKRELLFEIISEKALDYSIGWASPEEIDEINILQATYLAMKRAVEGLKSPPEHLLIDGNGDPQLLYPTTLLVQGDGKSATIAAASILAKVSRDSKMSVYGETYPEYEFPRHKGYPTKGHYEMLDRFGPSSIHRKSFLKKWEAKSNESLK